VCRLPKGTLAEKMSDVLIERFLSRASPKKVDKELVEEIAKLHMLGQANKAQRRLAPVFDNFMTFAKRQSVERGGGVRHDCVYSGLPIMERGEFLAFSAVIREVFHVSLQELVLPLTFVYAEHKRGESVEKIRASLGISLDGVEPWPVELTGVVLASEWATAQAAAAKLVAAAEGANGGSSGDASRSGSGSSGGTYYDSEADSGDEGDPVVSVIWAGRELTCRRSVLASLIRDEVAEDGDKKPAAVSKRSRRR